jgi:xylulokinase
VEHALAVDLGTGGPKVALVALDGAIADRESGITRLLLGPDGAAEQDPDDWWAAITAAVRRLLSRGVVDVDAIAAVSVTSHWSGTVAVGADGRHLMNAVMWMDSRGARYIGEVTGGRLRLAGYDARKLRRFVSRAGGLPGHSGKDPTAHIHWIRHERPDVYAATAVFCEPADYLNARLTGRICSSHDCIALHWVADIRDLRAVHYDDELLRISGLDRERLPELVPSATVVGHLLPSVAQEWGLRAGTPVVTVSGDVPSAVVGSGAVADYAGHLYIGTSSWLSCHVPWKRTDLFHNQTTLPSALPGRYFVANEHEMAGACLTFLKDTMLARPDGLGTDASDEQVYRAFDVVAARAPAGAGKVVFTPWLNGERAPVDDHTVRGGFHNLSLSTTGDDLVRAIYEGTAYNSRWLLDAVERFVRRKLPALAFIGGGAKSAVWSQIHADVLDRTILQVADPQLANVRGAAFIAFVALGLADPGDLARRVPIAAVYEPDVRNRARYDDLYAAFKGLYKRTRTAAKDAGRELLRRFLRCYGPAAPGDFADWTRIGVADARQRFTELADDLQEVGWDGRTGSVLRDDIDELYGARPPSGVRLLPPSDPYLLARDRITLIPDPAKRTVVWPALGAPGTLVVDGEIVATWRSQKKGTVLRVQISYFDRPIAKAVALIEQEAQLLAELRGCHTAEVT